uniref:Uncharacterized protein n=1 Tax=Glossina morsitans morsitans TaxID=37546 RepID=A0A1B0FDU0_GLOMM
HLNVNNKKFIKILCFDLKFLELLETIFDKLVRDLIAKIYETISVLPIATALERNHEVEPEKIMQP